MRATTRTSRVVVEPRLRRRSGGLDDEQLLLDSVVKVTRQPRPLLTSRDLVDVLVVRRSDSSGG